MAIFVTSDLHFNHDKEFLYAPRGFFSAEEMNEAIVIKWNEMVSPEDTVYILGDVGMGKDTAANIELLKSLNGKLYLAIGNHDSDAKIEAYKQANIFEDIQFGYRLKIKKKICVLTHYPTIVANDGDAPTINLYGHTHQQTNFYEGHWDMYHVGMDSHDCYPVNIEDALAEIRTERIKFMEDNTHE